MRIGFFLKESMRAMRRNAAPSFAALATVVVTMIVLGVVFAIGGWFAAKALNEPDDMIDVAPGGSAPTATPVR